MEIVFPSTDSEIMTIKNDSGTLITTGRKKERGLYRMEFDKNYNYQHPQRKSKTHPGHTCAVDDSVLVSLDVWHQRLGHVALERIKRIHREKQVVDGLDQISWAKHKLNKHLCRVRQRKNEVEKQNTRQNTPRH